MLFVGTSIIHPSTEGVFLLCNILDLLIYRWYNIEKNIVHNNEYQSLLAPIGCVNVTTWKKYNLKN